MYLHWQLKKSLLYCVILCRALLCCSLEAAVKVRRFRTIPLHRKMLETPPYVHLSSLVPPPPLVSCLMSTSTSTLCHYAIPMPGKITRVAKTSYCNQTKHHRQYPAPLSLANHSTSLANTSANSRIA
jgi:hypothetical protein